MPGADSYASKGAGITLGILLLLTFLIPFGLNLDGTPIWSWDLLKHFEQMPGEMKALLIGAWVIGLLALILGGALRGLPLATCYLILGIAGVVILFVIARPLARTDVTFPHTSTTITGISAKTLLAIWLIATAVFLIAAGVRSRLGGVIPVCTVQILIGAAFTALQGILLHDGIRAAANLPPGLDTAVWWNVIFMLVMQGLLALGGLFVFLHGFAFRSPGGELTTAGRVLVYVGLLGMVLYGVVAGPVQMNSFPLFLAMFNPMLMLVCLALLFLEGCISFLSELGAVVCAPIPRPAPAAAPAAPAPAPQAVPTVVVQAVPAVPAPPPPAPPPPAAATPSVQHRLQQLEAMFRDGTITEEEYKAQRARILGQL